MIQKLKKTDFPDKKFDKRLKVEITVNNIELIIGKINEIIEKINLLEKKSL